MSEHGVDPDATVPVGVYLVLMLLFAVGAALYEWWRNKRGRP